jgi:NAD(P)-dependent dehydrogenase (short-subunit alcohol dehydrogenase family)
MKDLKGKNAIVTGAASGIGRALAIELAREGANVVIASRNETAMEETAAQARALGVRAVIKKTDVSRKDEVRDLIDFAIKELGSVDILVNNAGVGMFIAMKDLDLERDWEWLVNTNLWGPIYGCHYVLPHMIKRGSGQIVNVSSMAAWFPAFGAVPYSTVKAGLVNMSDNIRIEVAHLGIGVTCACPGVTRTGMLVTQRTKEGQTSGLESSSFGQEPEVTARKIVAGIKKNKRLVLPSLDAKLTYFLRRFFPGLLYRLSMVTTKVGLRKTGQ